MCMGASPIYPCGTYSIIGKIDILLDSQYTVKPVLRDRHREGQNWLLKTGDPLIQVHLHCILVQGTQKMQLLWTGDPLIEVTT